MVFSGGSVGGYCGVFSNVRVTRPHPAFGHLLRWTVDLGGGDHVPRAPARLWVMEMLVVVVVGTSTSMAS